MSNKKTEIPFWIWPILGTLLIIAAGYNLLTFNPTQYYVEISPEEANAMDAIFVDINENRTDYINGSLWFPLHNCNSCWGNSFLRNLDKGKIYILYGQNVSYALTQMKSRDIKAYSINLTDWISDGYPVSTWAEEV